MPRRTEKEEKVYKAVSLAISRKGFHYKDIAKLIGVKEQTVRWAISSGRFSPEKAAVWSTRLDIPFEIFTEGFDPTPDRIDELEAELTRLREEVFELRTDVDELKRWRNVVIGKSDNL